MSVEPTHADLVALAARWLAGHERCSVVVTEMSSGEHETPDAIGWRGGNSIVVECKTSRPDFFADKKKAYRRTDRQMGVVRYYLTPKDMLQLAEVTPGWGLLEACPRGCSLRVSAYPQPEDKISRRAEIGLLLSCIRRIGQSPALPPGVAVKCYTIGAETPRATLGILPGEGAQ